MPEAACRDRGGQGLKEVRLLATTLYADSHRPVLHDLL